MKQTMITEYLAATGLLKHGTPAEIHAAKKQFWAIRRKQTRAIKRKEGKSIQVFYTQAEFGRLSVFAKGLSISRSRFVKQSSLNAMLHADVLYITQLLALRQLIMYTISKLEADSTTAPVSFAPLQELLIKLQAGIAELITYKPVQP